MPLDGDEPEELVELQLIEETRLEKLFAEHRKERGLNDEVTIDTFFKLFNMWIQLYRLNKAREVLDELVPICRERGGNHHIQGIQALAFTVWKQSDFKQAAQLFHEMEALVGPSSALCENIGHTYSSMGDFEQASRYFKMSLTCMDEEEAAGKEARNRAGVLLGLGIIENRQGQYEKALVTVREARRLFREKAGGKPASLIAKAGMSLAKILLKLASLEQDEAKRLAMIDEAISTEQENVYLFEVTCGADSPLTASALKGLGEAFLRRQKAVEALESFAKSYHLEVQKDAFDLMGVMDVHNLLVGVHMARMKMGHPLDREAFRSYLPTIQIGVRRVGEMKQDANAGAYYKVAGELFAFAEDYAGASKLLGDAMTLFATETVEEVSGLIATCIDLKALCDRQPPRPKPQATAASAGVGGAIGGAVAAAAATEQSQGVPAAVAANEAGKATVKDVWAKEPNDAGI